MLPILITNTLLTVTNMSFLSWIIILVYMHAVRMFLQVLGSPGAFGKAIVLRSLKLGPR